MRTSKISGNLVVRPGDTTDYSMLTHVSGYVYVLEGATLVAPALTEVEGYLFCEGVFDYSKIKFGAGEIIAISGYALHHKDGLLTAGCRVGWSYERALVHWGDYHENQARARIFAAAIKELSA
jgi:hypothetical protein